MYLINFQFYYYYSLQKKYMKQIVNIKIVKNNSKYQISDV